MRKKDLVLDFTSLLDVIMIILFVVLSTVGQASKEEVQAKIQENAEMQQELSDFQQVLTNLQNEYDKTNISNEELQKQLEELSKENNIYKAKYDRMNINEAQLYDSLMQKSQKITLVCTPYINSSKSDGNGVEITLYSEKAEDEQESFDVVIFPHNFDLTKEERAIKNAEMQANMYNALESIIKDNDLKLVLVTIEYTYDDKNFSQSDLNNIVGAIDDIERNYSVTCYIDKIKQ